MYDVMLVDDDYPVIELLSEAVDWEGLGLRLIGTHENGLSAWEQAEREMPDILITDIGMPRMNGLELIGRIKEKRPDVRVAILSCHSEFQYAQQAMRLSVQDYLLKDTLKPEELERLLAEFKRSLDEEKLTSRQHTELRQLVHETKDLRLEQWLKNFIQQPLFSPGAWLSEARSFGLLTEGEACLPVIGYIDGYRQAKLRYLSDQTLRFAIGNVLEEVLQGADADVKSIQAGYGVRETFLLFVYKPSLKVSVYDRVGAILKGVQAALDTALKVRMSFIIEEGCTAPEQLKLRLNQLLGSAAQRFYLEEGEIVKRSVPAAAAGDLFVYYDEASAELREVVLGKLTDTVAPVVERWVALIRAGSYSPETVKDWVLKLLLDLKLKLQSLQVVRPDYSAHTLNKEIAELDSLAQLQRWLTEYLHSLALLAGLGAGAAVRPEVLEACRYVSLHLDKRISLEEVAEQLYLNPSYFSRMFKKETGENFIEYVNRMKLERAKELLDTTGHSIGKICEMLGYDNQSYFIKIFKAYAGATPVEYRG